MPQVTLTFDREVFESNESSKNNKLFSVVEEVYEYIKCHNSLNWDLNRRDGFDEAKLVKDLENEVKILLLRIDPVTALLPSHNSSIGEEESDEQEDAEDEESEDSDWADRLSEILLNFIRSRPRVGRKVGYNTATRLLQLSLESLGVTYTDPKANGMARKFYSIMTREGMFDSSEWMDKYPNKLFHNLASSTNGISRYTVRDRKGRKLVTYMFTDDERVRAYDDLGNQGYDYNSLRVLFENLPKNFNIESEKIVENSNYARDYLKQTDDPSKYVS